ALGQANLNGAGASTTATGESAPSGLAFSGANLWVADTSNNRVLEYLSPFATGQAASVELGQAAGATAFTTSLANQNLAFPTAQTLYTPLGVAADSSGNVWVADSGNNRVLEFTPAFSNGEAASLVMGQPSFLTNLPSTSASSANVPRDVNFDATGNMWITDSANNRVMEITLGGGFTNDKAATLVVGQPSFNLVPN